MSSGPDITVVLPACNQWPRLRLVLFGLTRQQTRADWDLILIDDGSKVPIQHELERESELRALPLQLVILERNMGRNAARNIGAGKATGSYLLFLDGDALPHPFWMENHYRRLTAGKNVFTVGHIRCIDGTAFLADPEVPVLSSQTGVPEDYLARLRTDPAAMTVTRQEVLENPSRLHDRSHWGSIPMSKTVCNWWLAFMFFEEENGERPFLWQRFVPHNCGVSRRAFTDLGGFHEDYTFYEGMDLGYRLTRSGHDARLADDAVTYHLYHHRSLGFDTEGRRQRYTRIRALLEFSKKHRDREATLAALLYANPGICPDEFRISGPGDLVRLGETLTAKQIAFIELVLEFQAKLTKPGSTNPGPRLHMEDRGNPGIGQNLIPLEEYIQDRKKELNLTREEAESLVNDAGYRLIDLDGRLFVNHRAANTWHLKNTPEAFRRWMELDTHRLDFVLQRKAGYARTRELELTYESRIDTQGTDPNNALWAVLPFPVHDRNQRVIGITRMSPPHLQEHVHQETGLLFGVPLPRDRAQIEIQYTVKLSVDEVLHDLTILESEMDSGVDKMYFQHYLQLPSKHYLALRRCAKDITGDGVNVIAKAESIYDWVLDRKEFTLDDSLSSFEGYAACITERRATSCIGIAISFVLLARAADIPARLVQGYLQGFPGGEPGLFISDHDNPGFSHQWAEIHVPPAGWIPVEFHSCILRPPVLNAANVPDTKARLAWSKKAVEYEKYFLGSMDNLRVRSSYCPYGVFARAGGQDFDSPPDQAGLALPTNTQIQIRISGDQCFQ